MALWNSNLYILLETLLFLGSATAFFGVVGLAWRQAKPYDLPYPLPSWFKVWFLSVQLLGGLLPLLVMLLWGLWWGDDRVLSVFIPYFVVLGAQILTESTTLRWFHSVVWVMVPYLYVPYRLWQLYQGWILLNPNSELLWVQNLLLVEILVWTVNYGLDLAQLPRLFHWQVKENSLDAS